MHSTYRLHLQNTLIQCHSRYCTIPVLCRPFQWNQLNCTALQSRLNKSTLICICNFYLLFKICCLTRKSVFLVIWWPCSVISVVNEDNNVFTSYHTYFMIPSIFWMIRGVHNALDSHSFVWYLYQSNPYMAWVHCSKIYLID